LLATSHRGLRRAAGAQAEPPHEGDKQMIQKFLAMLLSLVAAAAIAQQAPDAMVKQVTDDVLDAVKADTQIQGGNLQRVLALVDTKVMPHVDIERMTAAAVGPYWRRQATAPQRSALQEQFKVLLVRTYAGALTQVSNQTIEVKPMRDPATGPDVLVRTEVRGANEPVEMDYRLEKRDDGWKIFDVNVLGVWLAENYRNTFAEEIGNIGIDGLIAALSKRNNAPRSP
jgi:phospholipid transport system substrate-binding protein